MIKHNSTTRYLATTIILLISLSLVAPALRAPPDSYGKQKKLESEPEPEPSMYGWMLHAGIEVVAFGVLVLLYLLRRRT
jgi:hypothetical protein